MVVPRDSAWFYDFDDDGYTLLPTRETKLYKEDKIGLKQLDDKGALVFEEVEGQHLEISIQWFMDNVVAKYMR